MSIVAENPMYTCGYEGFYHLDTLHGNVEEAVAEYIIRHSCRLCTDSDRAVP